MFDLKRTRLCVIGLGYVGLPLAVSFAKHFKVVAFDINPERVKQLSSGRDISLEIDSKELAEVADQLKFTNDLNEINECNVYIVTVPTPINSDNEPDLSPLLSACQMVGGYLKKNDLVIFESTVFPGCTENVCGTTLEKHSKLVYNRDFFCGYSPERINPGDQERTLQKIVKITAGSNEACAAFVDQLYGLVVEAGTYKVKNIQTAEAAKVIENTQRDLNIALINELTQLFETLNLDTEEVLRAAETKWNFQSFRPGLVGGHCIGVDPYYLTHIAIENGFDPKVILAGRAVNDGMSAYIHSRICLEFNKRNKELSVSKILCLGLTFKENCTDIRNSKIFDVLHRLETEGADVEAFDPYARPEDVQKIYGREPLHEWPGEKYDCIILSVAHDLFIKKMNTISSKMLKSNGFIFDVKYIAPNVANTIRL